MYLDDRTGSRDSPTTPVMLSFPVKGLHSGGWDTARYVPRAHPVYWEASEGHKLPLSRCGVGQGELVRALVFRIRNRVHYSQNHEIDEIRREQFERLMAKPRSQSTPFYLLYHNFLRTLRRPKVLT
jgi:hypothetical protein